MASHGANHPLSEISRHPLMAGISCCCSSAFSSRSNSGAISLRFNNTYHGRTATIFRKSLRINAEISYVNGEEARRLVPEEGYSIIDVRDRIQCGRTHIKSCSHVPLFIENKDNDPGTIVKRQLHNNFSSSFYGLPFTKPNPEFVESVKSQFSPESKILIVCLEGLRYSGAANKLEAAGCQNISCITSGLQYVQPDKLRPRCEMVNQGNSSRRHLLAGFGGSLAFNCGFAPLVAWAGDEQQDESLVGAIKSLFDPNEKTKSGKVLPKAYLNSAREVVKTLRESLKEDPNDVAKFRRVADAAKESIRAYIGNWRGQQSVINEESYAVIEKAIRSLASFYSKAGPSAPLPEQVKSEILSNLDTAEEFL